MWRPDTTLVTGAGVLAWSKIGRKSYELSNHLGNVLAVVSDKYAVVGSDPVAELLSAQDYYPFGMIQPGRSLSSEKYRYGFNGKENDNEVKGTGNQQDYGMRIYDPRVARFLSLDPLSKEYPWYTPYSYAGNMPIRFIDIDGLEQGPPNFFFEPMKYSGKNTVADYAKVVPNAATGVVNGAIALLYMASDGLNGAVKAFETGELPFSYKDVRRNVADLGSTIKYNIKIGALVHSKRL
jgi:RHS repeat-associated protein